jgi:uncharacterized membrane protein YeaQ/YmgE (transglycosylase-associated protein family)
MSDTTQQQTQKLKPGKLLGLGLLAIAVAVIGNIIVLWITEALFTIPASFMPMAIPPITIFTVIGVVGAIIVFALLARFTQQPVRRFWIISVVVLLLSFIPNIATLTVSPMPGATVPGVVSLMIMHVVAAAAAVGILPRAISE